MPEARRIDVPSAAWTAAPANLSRPSHAPAGHVLRASRMLETARYFR